MAPLPLKMVFATMVTLANTKNEARYIRMTQNWYGGLTGSLVRSFVQDKGRQHAQLLLL